MAIQSADKQQDKNIPIQVVPLIMRVDAGKSATLRFIYSGHGLPEDRESLFWINTQEIPPASDKQNVLQIAVHSRLKLFYRPKTLKTNLEDEVKKLKWSLHGNTVSVTNNGPMYISLNKLHVSRPGSARSDVEIDMIGPHSTREFNLPTSLKLNEKISFNYVNDFGGTTEVADVSLE
ncbi:fimbrial biogenesis chaperone [Citrobacter amalonaticus]